MKTDDYRREYAAFCSALERARYAYRSHLETELQLPPIRERYADLWTRDAIADLERAFEDAPPQFETERTALRALLYAARLGYLDAQTREITNELLSCEAATPIEWEGARLTLGDVPERIAIESDTPRRRDLTARWFDALRGCDDLRRTRVESLGDVARTLGFESLHELLNGASPTGNDVKELNASARAFLTRTESLYTSHLAEWAAQQLPTITARGLTYADSIFFARLSHLDHFFPAHQLLKTYDAAMSNLGIRVSQQANLQVEINVPDESPSRANCFGVNPPDDVRLVGGTCNGVQTYANFWQEVGRAQQFAWTSRDLAARYPEFIHAPDLTTQLGYAFLFRNLLHDSRWLVEHHGVKVSAARIVARSVALLELYEVRLCCSRLEDESAWYEPFALRSEQMAETYATRRTEATGFRYDQATRLLEAGGGSAHHIQENLFAVADIRSSSSELRARLYAAALGEHLRTRYGHRWWASRGACDELIDLWNTGSRYSVEELASLAGLGALDVELFVETLISVLSVD